MVSPCAELRRAYQQDGFAVARELVPKEALEAALGPEGLPAALTVGRYGYEKSSTLTTLEHLPKGVADMSSMNLIHNGHFLHAIKGLWPLIMSASFGAGCVFGMLPESFEMHQVRDGPIASVLESMSGDAHVLRMNAHMKLAPKVPGVSDQHVAGHRDYDYWRHRFKGRPQHYRDDFVNSTVTAWIPLVPVDRYGSMIYGREKAEQGDHGDPTRDQRARSLSGVQRVQVRAEPGDVLLHGMDTYHWSTLMQNTSERVRWHVELRFHNAAVLDRLDMSDDELHHVMTGPAIEKVDTERSYATLLDVIFQGIEKVRWRFNADTLGQILSGSDWRRQLEIPVIGLGTGRLWPVESIAPAMHSFLLMGGRHLDTAVSYWSQSAVAAVCRAAMANGVGKDLVITTKIWPLGFKESLEAARGALKQLDGVGQVVILLHSPGQVKGKPKAPGGQKFAEAPASCRDEARPTSWRRCRAESFMALAALREAGVVSGIGVSNFLKRHLEELRRDLRALKAEGSRSGRGLLRTWPPDVVQHEVHLLQREEELVRYCRLWNITVVSYGTLGSPEAKAKLLDHPVVRQAAEMEGLTAAQVLMKWALQRGLHLIPTTSNPEHMQQLLQVPQLPQLRRGTLALLESVPQWEAPIYHPYLEAIE